QTEVNPVNIKEAIDYCALAWNEVSCETIKNCWRKAGILPADDNNSPQQDISPYNEYPAYEHLDDEIEVHNLIEQLPINVNDLLSASEYIKIDDNLSTTEIPSNQEILTILQEDEDEDASEPAIQIPLKTVLESLENVRLLLLNPPETLRIENEDSK
ncbi:5253_t:CDS:1, partial [Racocetra persica]